MNHLLEAWITWIKYKPAFTGKPNSKLDTLTLQSRKRSRQNQEESKKGEKNIFIEQCTVSKSRGCYSKTSAIHICKRLKGGPSPEMHREMDRNENRRWRAQRQWLIHQWSHVLNFLKEPGGMREGCARRRRSQCTKRFCTLHSRRQSQFDLFCSQIKHSWLGRGRGGGFGERETKKKKKNTEETAGKDSHKMTRSQQMVRMCGGAAIIKGKKAKLCPQCLLHVILWQGDGNRWTLTHSLRTAGHERCQCVGLFRKYVWRLIWREDSSSIPVVPWDCCSLEVELWESPHLAAKQGSPSTRGDVNPFNPQSTYVPSLCTGGHQIRGLFSLRVLHINPTSHSKPTHAFSPRRWLQSKLILEAASTFPNNDSNKPISSTKSRATGSN